MQLQLLNNPNARLLMRHQEPGHSGRPHGQPRTAHLAAGWRGRHGRRCGAAHILQAQPLQVLPLRIQLAKQLVYRLGAALRLRTLQQTLDGVGRKLGLKIRAVEMSDPLAAIDVDKAADHELVTAILEGRA